MSTRSLGAVRVDPSVPGNEIRWRGANVVCKPTQAVGWTDFWGGQWDESWVTTQIDRGITVGCNVFRIIGGANGVSDGTYSRATYLARQQIVLDYCTSRGVWYYPCGAGDYSTPLTTATRDELVAHASALVGASNVLGFDILQEWDIVADQKSISYASMATTLSGWAAAIHTANPSLRRSCSVSSVSAATHSLLSGFVDFYDFHTYLSFAPNFTLTDKRHVIGEFGAAISLGATERNHRYENIRAWVNNNTYCDGALAWALADQESPPASNAFGLFDNNGVERTDMTDMLRTFPLTNYIVPRSVP